MLIKNFLRYLKHIFASIFRLHAMATSSDGFIITKLSTNSEGDTFFESINIITTDVKPLGLYSEGVKVKELYFRKSLSAAPYDFHPAPQQQYIIYLSGAVEIETSKGIKKVFKAGNILLVTDTYGKGHKTTIIENGEAVIVTS
jgi:hypothetical protein